MDKPPGWAAYQAFIRGLPDDQLFNAVKAMEGLEEHPGWPVLADLVAYRERVILEPLVHNPVLLPRAGYARQLGMISGIRQAGDLLACLRYGAYERTELRLEQERRAKPPE